MIIGTSTRHGSKNRRITCDLTLAPEIVEDAVFNWVKAHPSAKVREISAATGFEEWRVAKAYRFLRKNGEIPNKLVTSRRNGGRFIREENKDNKKLWMRVIA